MTFQQELNSWLSPSPTDVQSPPEINSKAPSSSKLPLPNSNRKPTIITFLRHCGCPVSFCFPLYTYTTLLASYSLYLSSSNGLILKSTSQFKPQLTISLFQFAEKTFLTLRNLATSYPNINIIAISHSTSSSTDTWVESLGGAGPIQVVVDSDREIYAQWGLGTSSAWHVLNPWSMFSVFKLGREEQIWNRPTESGSRWQTSGSWVVDKEGIVKGGGVAKSADEIMNFEEAIKLIE